MPWAGSSGPSPKSNGLLEEPYLQSLYSSAYLFFSVLRIDLIYLQGMENHLPANLVLGIGLVLVPEPAAGPEEISSVHQASLCPMGRTVRRSRRRTRGKRASLSRCARGHRSFPKQT